MKNSANVKGSKSLVARGSSILLLGTLLLLGACNSGLEPQVPTADLSTQGSGSCLNDGGKLIKMSGNYNKAGIVRRQSNARVDARGAKFLGRKPALLSNGNRGLCFSGGVVDVGLSLSASWSTFHNAAGILFYDSPNAIVEKVAVLNAGDGISFKDNNQNWNFRNSYIRNAGDDGIENDRGNSGRVSGVLVDNAFMGVSCRREKNRKFGNSSLTIENSLIAMNPKRSAYMFKWTFDTKSAGCRLTLKNNVFLLPKSAGYMDIGDHPRIKSRPLNEGACRGNKNTIVYTGRDKRYLEQLKKASPACFNVTTDKNVWTKARNAWFSRNPEFSKYR